MPIAAVAAAEFEPRGVDADELRRRCSEVPSAAVAAKVVLVGRVVKRASTRARWRLWRLANYSRWGRDLRQRLVAELEPRTDIPRPNGSRML